MSNKHLSRGAKGNGSNKEPTLADVQEALKSHDSLSVTRRRDLLSGVKRVAKLLNEEPIRIKLDLPAISARLAAVSAAGTGISPKRLSNIRSDFLAAVKGSGLAKIERRPRPVLSRAWADLMAGTALRRVHIGLSRLARFASANGIEPQGIDDAAMERFIGEVREGSLHPRPKALHRKAALIWNEVAKLSELKLNAVSVPTTDSAVRRVEWALLQASFRTELEEHLKWCGGADPFDVDARDRPLAEQTVKLRRNQIHTAVTALIDSGVEPAAITSLAFLVTPETFKKILRRRLEAAGQHHSVFNRDLGAALVQIAEEWVEVDASVLTELKRLVGKMPVPAAGLTDKNKAFLRHFDDPEVLKRLLQLPGKLWKEIKRDNGPGFIRLAKAEAALAIGTLLFIPLRPQNLTALTFDVHLFLRNGMHAVATLEVAADEVKNGTALEFDIPPQIAKMMIEFRDRIAPKIIGHRPAQLFVNPDGTAKCQEAVSDLITRTLYRRAGIVMTPHQFRHLSAKLMLDDSPGNFVSVSHILGHKNLKTGVVFYGGIDSRRAARHHQRLIERKLAEPAPRTRRRRPKKDDQDLGDIT